MRFYQGARRLGTEHQSVRVRDGVERLVAEPQILGVSLNELDVIETFGPGTLRGHTDHLRRQIDCHDSTARLDSACRSKSRITRAARDVEHARACAPRRYVAEPGGQRREVALGP